MSGLRASVPGMSSDAWPGLFRSMIKFYVNGPVGSDFEESKGLSYQIKYRVRGWNNILYSM